MQKRYLVTTALRQQRFYTMLQRQQVNWLRSIQPTFEPTPVEACDPLPPVAHLFLESGEGASEHLRRIITHYPNSDMAREARRLLGLTESSIAPAKLGMIRSDPQP